MLTFAPADLTLAIVKATERFFSSAIKPTDEYIFSIKTFLTAILVRVNPYDETNNQHNLAGVVLASSFYQSIYNKGPFVVPEVVTVYDIAIDVMTAKTLVKRAELAHEAKQSNRAIYDAADTSCVHFIMSVVDKTWYKELKDPDTFYMNVTALQLLDHLEEH